MHQRGELPDAEAGARGGRHEQHRQLLALLPGAGDDGAVSHRRLRRRLRLDRGHRAGRPGGHHRQQHRREPPGAGDAREAGAQAARPEADRRRSARARDGASAPTSSCAPNPAPTSSGSRPSAAICSTTVWRTPSSSTSGSTAWTSTARASSRSRWSSPHARAACPSRRSKQVAHMIAEARRRLHPVGDGRHAAQRRAPTRPRRSRTCCSSPATTCGPGTGAYPLRGHNNVQGASDHGAMPNVLPGYQIGRRSRRCERASRRRGASRSRPPRDSTTTRWSTRSTRASSRRCTSSARR